MYKYLILACTFFVVGGAGYYFNALGGSALVVKAITQEDSSVAGVPIAEVFSGTYECDVTSGCKNVTRITLFDDTSVSVEMKIEEETSVSEGTWGIAKNKNLIIILQPTTINATNSLPISLTAKKVDLLKLSDFSSRKGLPSGMNNPTFTRVAN